MNENHEEAVMEAARQEAIKKGWKKYRFSGEPPIPGSIAEQRMIETAEKYIRYAFSKKLRGKDVSSKPVQDASESEQRVLHNTLAIMIYGKPRTGMAFKEATDIKDYATSIAFPGFSTEQVYEMLNSEESNE